MAGTTPVTTLRGPSTIFAGTQTRTQPHLDTLIKTTDLHFISLSSLVGTAFFCTQVESVVSNQLLHSDGV